MTKVTKPILLDETGRAINETLERIRQTIDQRNKVDWGEIEGLLADQADLVAEFDKKENKHILLKHCDSDSDQEVLAEVFDVVSEHVGQGFRWVYEGGEDRLYPTLFVTGNPTSVAFAYTETRLVEGVSVTEVAIAKITLVDGLYQYEEQRTELLSKEVAEGRFVDFSSDQNVQGFKTFANGVKMPFTNTWDSVSQQTLTALLGAKATTSQLKAVTDKIPAQASADNQLADKAFVNSSIATNTANFIGTFNSLEELEEYPTTDLTNNDYAFVIGSDGEGNVQYSRYKWTGTEWLFEYVLNNSSFTEAQWATINSGLTGNDVTALRSALTLIGNVIPNDASGANKLVTRQYMEDRHVILPLLTLEATQEQLAGVYNAILNAPTGSAFFISLPEGRGIMPLATAIGGTSVFAQYADGRYSHELKITLTDGVYLFEKVDKTFATSTDLNNYYTKEQSNNTFQSKLTAGSGITIEGNVISATGGEEPKEVYDPHTTYIYLSLTAGTYDFRGLVGASKDGLIPVAGKAMSIDWGDGTGYDDIIAAYTANDDNLKHRYASGNYVLKITNVANFNNLVFREKAYTTKFVFGADLTAIRNGAFSGSVNLSEIIMQGDVFSISASVIQNCTNLKRIFVPFDAYDDYIRYWSWYKALITTEVPDTKPLYTETIVSVGEGGDFASIGKALKYLSLLYPTYKRDGIKCQIKILQGTTITEQILVRSIDLSYIEIVAEGYNPDNLVYDNVRYDIADGTRDFRQYAVPVDARNWTGVTHDTRGDKAFLRAEDGGRLPVIGCLFKLVNQDESDQIAGMVCNRGSEGVVKTLCGFFDFFDGVISNNESSITIREGITMGCSRWGCHSRHNGEVSARSVIATGCATISTAESAALCSDRVADLDGREAFVSAGGCQLRCNNASRLNCNGTHIIGQGTTEITSTYGSIGNYFGMFVDGTIKLTNELGGTMVVSNYTFDTTYQYNTVSRNGIIYK